jgi:hypothetical protein
MLVCCVANQRSESTPEMCHRRLVAEYLKEKLDGIEIKHL